MPAPEFIDTNVLVYAWDPGNTRKQRVARAEFAATLLHKMTPASGPADVTTALDALGPIRTVVPDAEIVRRAVEARAQYGIHFYDGMIVAAAERGGYERIWSEDLNAGQAYFGIVVANPFA